MTANHNVDVLIREGARYTRRPPTASAPPPSRWSLVAEAGVAAHLYLYDAIGWPGIVAKDVVEQVRGHARRPLQVHINSPGGDVFDGLAIHNLLRQHGAPVDVRVEGLAASIASLIAMSGSTLRMAAASLLMMHEPHAVVMGTAHDMRHMAGLLDKATGIMADAYARRGADREKVRAWMHDETWWSARGAFDAGLIDAIDDDPLPVDALAASATFDLSGFRRAPSDPASAAPSPSHAPRHREGARVLATGFDRLLGIAPAPKE